MSQDADERLIRARAEELGKRLTVLRLTLAAAESCTGGGLADAITDVAGSSNYFLGGIVAYANRAKERLLGVDPGALASHGSVSEAVAAAMAEGARRAFGADLGVGITGIAGPGGGTPDKPVGLVFIAVAGPGGSSVRRHVWRGDRTGNKRRSVATSLEMLLERIEAPSP